MIQVDYYTSAVDRLLIACRLCAKVVQQLQRMLILSDDSLQLTQLDKLLWTFSQVSFVPHCFINDKLASVTPIILGSPMQAETSGVWGCNILLNLHEEILPCYQQFQRVIEIVGNTDRDKERARNRYRMYQAQGCHVRHHNLDKSPH